MVTRETLQNGNEYQYLNKYYHASGIRIYTLAYLRQADRLNRLNKLFVKYRVLMDNETMYRYILCKVHTGIIDVEKKIYVDGIYRMNVDNPLKQVRDTLYIDRSRVMALLKSTRLAMDTAMYNYGKYAGKCTLIACIRSILTDIKYIRIAGKMFEDNSFQFDFNVKDTDKLKYQYGLNAPEKPNMKEVNKISGMQGKTMTMGQAIDILEERQAGLYKYHNTMGVYDDTFSISRLAIPEYETMNHITIQEYISAYKAGFSRLINKRLKKYSKKGHKNITLERAYSLIDCFIYKRLYDKRPKILKSMDKGEYIYMINNY